mgnify:CR=1 FL=1
MHISCIRHGESYHNVDFNNSGVDAYFDVSNTDPHLTENGINMAIRLYNNWSEKSNVEIVFVSPLLRTLETCECIFGKYPSIPIVVLDTLLESPQGSHTPNIRSPKSTLEIMYPDFIFDTIKEYQKEYTQEETVFQLKERVQTFNYFLKQIKETNVAVIGHNSFFKEFLNIDENINHCTPYTKINV